MEQTSRYRYGNGYKSNCAVGTFGIIGIGLSFLRVISCAFFTTADNEL